MGPARALMSKKVQEKHIFKYFIKIIVFDLHIAFFNSFNAFLRFLAEMSFRTITKLHQKTNVGPKMGTTLGIQYLW